ALYMAEAETCLAEGQVLPAHDYVLKCSQTFNLLDTRGAIGVTERADFFRKMRALSRKVAQTYVEQRQSLEFPWLDENDRPVTGTEPRTKESTDTMLTAPAPLLVEIGTEELPYKDLEDALAQLRQRVPAMLNNLRLEHSSLKMLGTPRRLVIMVEDLAPRQEDIEKVVKGPPASRAFDEKGNPTKAAQGFARSKGISPSELETREMDGGTYVVAVIKEHGQSSLEVLAQALPALIAKIQFSKTMRWESTGTSFSRPIRWLLALHGTQIIPFQYAGLQSSNLTYGMRFYLPEKFEIHKPEEYLPALESQGIILDPDERRQRISAQIQALAEEVGGEIPSDPDLLNEVTNLVEAPTALRGEFEAEYLELPRYVLTSVMKKHQRYFPIEKNGNLLPYFITVRNGDDQHLDIVRQGNADVIRARFADAAYFVREDIKKPLESYVPKLDKLTFHAELGSMLDKTKRLEKLVHALAEQLHLSAEEEKTAARAAHLCKADLATQMVIEMTSLQGLMGRDYALKSGESEEVAKAIFEHYLPRSANDSYPESRPGLAMGIADRLDSLVGLFAAGVAPTGNKDPFAQRRSAMGLVLNLIHWNLDFDLRKAIETTATFLPLEASEESKTTCLTFITERLRNILLEEGNKHDVVDAVLAAQGHNPARAAAAVKALSAWVKRDDWEKILPEYARCVRITRDLKKQYYLDADLLHDEAEKGLYQALVTAAKTPREEGSVDDFLNAFLPMIPSITQFFDEVLVMTEDQTARENRLALLQRIVSLAEGVADMSRLEGF
ncbi:MAG: glycine--tRNA ligase subunit beta, partial [Anaerolineales bacterium]|nr:glycine--tRNA ligase subunit beta [Anaerolineales bacterium]